MPAPADTRRLAALRAALGFLQVAPRAHELLVVWIDCSCGAGIVRRVSDGHDGGEA
jgi:hypothetical protein